jgi:hypothetical protein
MTKVIAEKMFKRDYLPLIVRGEKEMGNKDYPLRSIAWNEYVDELYRAGLISESQVDRWCVPKYLTN